MTAVLELTKQLINLPSVTPAGEECLNLISARLAKLGFNFETLNYGSGDTIGKNIWARLGNAAPLVCFLGHVDVVPVGDLAAWDTDPFQAIEKEGLLYGRGASDMKSGVAASVVAIEEFITKHPNFNGSIALLLTTVEEDLHEFGVMNVVDWLTETKQHIDYCITGEPSSTDSVGDVIRNGRRGSLNAKLTILGTQGHVAFPHLADNPIHKMLKALDTLVNETWDNGNQDFPPTSLQISNILAGTGATNVIPGEVKLDINFRFSPEVTAEALQQRTEAILQAHQLDYAIEWSLSGKPFYTPSGKLLEAAVQAVEQVCCITPTLSTGGGTSDARFIAPMGAEVIELGVSNKMAHKVNEYARINNINKLPEIYKAILNQLLL